MKKHVTIGLLALALLWMPTAWAASDEEQIDEVISRFWETFQSGDFNAMGQYVADDVVVVSGTFAPPTIGWTNVKQAYVSQHNALQNIQITRQNTHITVRGKVAWAVQQWVFSALAERQPISTAGHTTLIFEKRGGRWLIVLNHSSVVLLPQTPAPTQPPAPGR